MLVHLSACNGLNGHPLTTTLCLKTRTHNLSFTSNVVVVIVVGIGGIWKILSGFLVCYLADSCTSDY